MIKATKIGSMCLAVCLTAVATADGLHVPAAPGAPIAQMPQVDPGFVEGTIVPGPVTHWDTPPVALFTNVKYRSQRNIARCAVPKIIKVNDPCACNDGCCGPKCVYIEICVPPCECETVRCRRHGDRLRYYYGKYKVDVRIKKGYIVVDYKD